MKYPNCIAFNGTVIQKPILVGDNVYAINILSGDTEDFPYILITTEEKLSLKLNDKISGVGVLKKSGNDFVVFANQINRLLSDEEIENLK